MAKLKYKLEEKFAALPRSVTKIENLKKELKKHNITLSAYYRDSAIEIDDSTSIPSDRLDAYSILLGCSVDDLKNYTVKGKSLREKFASQIKLKTGLA